MRKFIINDNELIMGDVEFHKDLIGINRSSDKTIGGGLWHWDEEKNAVYFWGISTDFGGVTKDQFEGAVKNSLISPFMDESKFLFSDYPGSMDVNKMDTYIKLFEEIRRICDGTINQFGICLTCGKKTTNDLAFCTEWKPK